MGLGVVCLTIVCLVIEAIIFLLVLVGTPIDAFRSKNSFQGRHACFSMWGSKRCGNHKVSYPKGSYKGFGCKDRRDMMNAAAAFAIFSIFLTLVTMVLCILLICKVAGKIIPAIFGCLCAIMLLITWACQAGALHRSCDGAKLSTNFKYAGSFGLMVTAWCLQVINVIIMFVA